MTSVRYFARKHRAVMFAKEVGSKVDKIEDWNPMKDFGYRWIVKYKISDPR